MYSVMLKTMNAYKYTSSYAAPPFKYLCRLPWAFNSSTRGLMDLDNLAHTGYIGMPKQ